MGLVLKGHVSNKFQSNIIFVIGEMGMLLKSLPKLHRRHKSDCYSLAPYSLNILKSGPINEAACLELNNGPNKSMLSISFIFIWMVTLYICIPVTFNRKQRNSKYRLYIIQAGRRRGIRLGDFRLCIVCKLPALARKPEVGGQSRKNYFCSS